MTAAMTTPAAAKAAMIKAPFIACRRWCTRPVTARYEL